MRAVFVSLYFLYLLRYIDFSFYRSVGKSVCQSAGRSVSVAVCLLSVQRSMRSIKIYLCLSLSAAITSFGGEA